MRPRNVICRSKRRTRSLSEKKAVLPMGYDALAADYARHRRVHPEVLKNLLLVGEIGASSRVLEVGCGTGNYTVALQGAVGCTCWGIDPSEEMLALARRSGGGILFRAGMAERLEFDPESFDLVFSVDVIHHVADRAAYLREACRVLRRGGKLCTVTDSEEIICRRQPLTTHFPETVEPELQRYPRVGELKTLMAEAGFGAVEDAVVEFAYVLSDIQAYRDKAFSSLHLISDRAFRAGIARMERDLRDGPIPCVSRYLLLWGLNP